MKPTTEPSQPFIRRRLRRLGLGAAVVLACAVTVVVGLLRHEPAFYRSRIAAALDGEPPPEKVQPGRKKSARRAESLVTSRRPCCTFSGGGSPSRAAAIRLR